MTTASNNTKQRLIDTARELIWSESYNAVSVDEMCKKSDVKKGSFYHYFPSKSHLAMAAMDACMNDIKIAYDDIFSATRPPVERFKLMVRYIIDQQREVSKTLGHVCGCPLATLGSELAAQNKEIGKQVNSNGTKKASYYKSTLRDLVEEGLIPKDTDVDVKADEILAFVVGLLIVARIKDDLSFVESNLERALFDLIGLKQIVE